jgi:putative zinc finger/helix-turn-helix YgiT family protein
MTTSARCPTCGAETSTTVAERSLSVSGLSFIGSLPAARCDSCDTSTFAYADLERFELEVASALVNRGVRSAEAFRFVRKALGLRGADAAALLGVSAETISRWENGKLRPDTNAIAVLGGLVADRLAGRSTMLDRLRALADPKPVEGPIRVEVETVHRSA